MCFGSFFSLYFISYYKVFSMTSFLKKVLGLSKQKPHRIGLALGGGGVRGFVHLGVLKALQEQGISYDIISGTSAGSLAGVFLATGMAPDAIHELLKAKDIFGYSRFHWPKDGLFKLNGLREVIEKNIKTEYIEDLPTPLMVTTTNLNKGCVEYMSQGKISEVVLASASVPFLFAPIDINGEKYSDGGIFDNLPIKPLLDQCQQVIAVSVSPVEETKDLNSLIKVAARTFQLSVNANSTNAVHDCHLLIEPEGIGKFDLFDTSEADRLFEIGYTYTSKLNVKQLLKDSKAP